MADLDPEIVERAQRWCAESGRPVREEVVRRVLSPLGWDEMLAVKAVLADPPPRRDLSPADLVELSRGGAPAAEPSPAPRATARARGPRPSAAVAGPRIRRARDRVAPSEPRAPALAPLELLYRESGRGLLERLLRKHGASRVPVLAALAQGHESSGHGPTGADLDALLAHHGMTRAFAERERALLLHTFRKHGGVGARVARELGLSAEELAASLSRLSLGSAVESIREARRRALERKVTLAERTRLLDEEEETLVDLGILPRFEEDLRRRLPEQIRALAVGGRRPSAIDLGRSLSLSRPAIERIVARFSLALRAGDRGGSRSSDRPASRFPGRSPRPSGERGTSRPGERGARPTDRTGRPPDRTGRPPARPGRDPSERSPRRTPERPERSGRGPADRTTRSPDRRRRDRT